MVYQLMTRQKQKNSAFIAVLYLNHGRVFNTEQTTSQQVQDGPQHRFKRNSWLDVDHATYVECLYEIRILFLYVWNPQLSLQSVVLSIDIGQSEGLWSGHQTYKPVHPDWLDLIKDGWCTLAYTSLSITGNLLRLKYQNAKNFIYRRNLF